MAQTTEASGQRAAKDEAPTFHHEDTGVFLSYVSLVSWCLGGERFGSNLASLATCRLESLAWCPLA